MIEIEKLTKRFGDLAAVDDLSLTIPQGELFAFLGPNGAGKTTTLGAISGIVKLFDGSIEILGNEVPKLRSAYLVATWGVVHVPENRGLFFQLTVDENLKLAPRLERGDTDEAYELFPALKPLRDRMAGTLSGGEQQMLALGRGLLSHPDLFMVDEMSLGLAPVIYERLMPLVRRVADETNAAVLLVEQHTDLALAQADRAYVLSHGDMVLQGSAADLLQDRHLIDEAYLGGQALEDDSAVSESRVSEAQDD
jgi:branched-chain amino acid transport system ATP-binding protein